MDGSCEWETNSEDSNEEEKCHEDDTACEDHDAFEGDEASDNDDSQTSVQVRSLFSSNRAPAETYYPEWFPLHCTPQVLFF